MVLLLYKHMILRKMSYLDEEICLPEDTLKILNEFLQEKERRERNEEENIRNKIGKDAEFEEDWQLSQFWYNESTKVKLAGVVGKLTDSNPDIKCALLSCPSLYISVKELCDNVRLFEYDRRFSVYGDDFIFYDFNEAGDPNCLKEQDNQFDIIIADPPFLSEECIMKVCKIINKIKKRDAKIIFCSGEVIEEWLLKNLDVKKCKFKPEHERNLGNEFISYANFELDELINK